MSQGGDGAPRAPAAGIQLCIHAALSSPGPSLVPSVLGFQMGHTVHKASHVVQLDLILVGTGQSHR